MTKLDRNLILEARRLTTAANVHRVKELIFAYEMALEISSTNALECESSLRQFVCQQRSCTPNGKDMNKGKTR